MRISPGRHLSAIGVLALLLLTGCTITVLHTFEDRYYIAQGLTPPSPNAPAPGLSEARSGPTGQITFINDPDKLETIEISRSVPGQQAPLFVGRLLPADSLVVPNAQKGDVYLFSVSDAPEYKLPAYKVNQLNVSHLLSVGIRWKDARNNYTKIASADASRSSYDIFYIDPIDIDDRDNGGLKGQVFEELQEDDTDWQAYDGGITMKKTFSLKVDNTGEGNITTETYYGSQAFKNGLSVNIGISGEVPGAGKAGLSTGFSRMTENESARGEVFSFARKSDTVYYVQLVPEQAKLTSAFKHAVLALPVQASAPGSLDEALTDPGFQAYRDFIATWGTHYATRTYYGGFMLQYKRSSLEEYLNSNSFKTDVGLELSAPIKGVQAGLNASVGVTNEEKYVNQNSTERIGYIYRGGQGDFDNYTVGSENVQPIKIELERLSDLLTPQFFKDDVPAAALAYRRAMLAFALEEYTGSKTGNTPLRPQIYKIAAQDWRLLKSHHDNDYPVNLYGKVQIMTHKNYVAQNAQTVWNRSDAGGGRVLASKGYTEDLSSPANVLTVIVDPENGQVNPQDYQLSIWATFYKWNGILLHDCIGDGAQVISLDKVDTDPMQLLTLEFRQGKNMCDKTVGEGYYYGDENWTWQIDVNARVWKVEFPQLGFDGF